MERVIREIVYSIFCVLAVGSCYMIPETTGYIRAMCIALFCASLTEIVRLRDRT
jgi:hypothetical protein